MLSGYDDEYGNGWDEDFLLTQREYDGVLVAVECEYCCRDLIHGERLYKIEDYGKVCVDCRDIIREIDGEDE